MAIAAIVSLCIVPAIGYQCSKVFEPLKRTVAFVLLALLILALPAIDGSPSVVRVKTIFQSSYLV